jgi:Xaa-Pro aminopeptidase
MNTPTPTPTPRTDAAWAKTFEDDENQCRAGNAATDMRDECATLERELTALTAERDQLRSDCENETKWAAHYLAQSIADKARAERAEAAETVALAQWNGALERAIKAEADLAALEQCHDANCRGVVKIAAELDTEREKAERYRLVTLKQDAELATERARLDSGTILLTVAGERVWHCGVDLRAAIDAAMKEDAK